MSTTPTTPQWAIEAAKAILSPMDISGEAEHVAAIIARHAPAAPPLSPPTDEAKLREVITEGIYAVLCDQNPNAEAHANRILTALAPYLKGEPGDSELLEWLLDYITRHGLNGLKKLAWTCYDEDGESLMHRKTVSEEEVGDCRFDRAAIRAAMRREGDKL